jgi:hypothetical protein
MPVPKPPHGTPSASWWEAGVPTSQIALAALTYVGVHLSFANAGRIFGFRAYLAAGDPNYHWCLLWNYGTGQLLAAKAMYDMTQVADGWRQCWIHPTVGVNNSDTYMLAILFGTHYYRSNARLSGGTVTFNGIQFINSFQSTGISPPSVTPTPNSNANGVDVLFQ